MPVVYICAALKISTGTPTSRGPSATAELLVVPYTTWNPIWDSRDWYCCVQYCTDGCVFRRLAPLLMSYVKTGSPKQAKYAIRCIDAMCRSKEVIFKQLFEVQLHLCLYIHSLTMNCRHFDQEDVLLKHTINYNWSICIAFPTEDQVRVHHRNITRVRLLSVGSSRSQSTAAVSALLAAYF